MRDDTFERFYSELIKYKDKFGNLRILRRYEDNDYSLGLMVNAVRRNQYYLSSEQRKRLDDIGFIWPKQNLKNKHLKFDQVVQLLLSYKQEHGHIDVPNNYTTSNGINLGIIVANIRRGYRNTTEEEKKILTDMGFCWISKHNVRFEKLYKLLLDYKKKYGNLRIKVLYETDDGIHLGKIVSKIRCGKRTLDDYQRKQLDDIGFIWKVRSKNVKSD